MSSKYQLTNVSLSITFAVAIAINNHQISHLLSPLAQRLYYPFVMPHEWLIIGNSASDSAMVGILLAAILAPINAVAIWFQMKNHSIEYASDYKNGLFPKRKSIIKGMLFMTAIRSVYLYFSMNDPAAGMIRTSRDAALWQLFNIISIPCFVIMTSVLGMFVAMFFAVPDLSKAQDLAIQPTE